MRTVRLKINATVKPLLRQASQQFNIDDPGFTEDIYALFRLKGAGLPDDKRTKLMVSHLAAKHKRSESMVGALFRKRCQVLKSLVTMPYFNALLKTERDPVAATNRLLTTFRKLHSKSRASKCLSCAHRAGCDFGQQYGDRVFDPAIAIQPDLRKKVSPACPSLPELDANAAMADAMLQAAAATNPSNAPLNNIAGKQNPMEASASNAISELERMEQELDNFRPSEDGLISDLDAESDVADFKPHYEDPNSEGGGASSIFSTTFRAESFVRMTEASADRLLQSRLLLFELGRKLDFALKSAKSGRFKPVKNPSRSTNQGKIKSLKEITELQPSQHGLPAEVFEARALKKDLVKVQHEEQESKKQLLYLLVDSSASMSDMLTSNGGILGLLTKASIASVFAICLARRLRDEGGIMYLRFFDGAIGPLFSAKTKDQFEPMMLAFSTVDSNGGGTDICGAVSRAVADIKQAEKSDELASAEILLITDCQDRFSAQHVQLAAQGTKINVLDVSGKTGKSNVKQQLMSIAAKYYKVDETELDINKMVQLV